MEEIARRLTMKLPARQSAFLWGPRKTGKSSYLKKRFPNSILYDFLRTELFIELSKNPALLRQQLLAQESYFLDRPVILDEVQKVPQILDEVHALIEDKGLQFILCGSSARKLKRGKANLLGRRACEEVSCIAAWEKQERWRDAEWSNVRGDIAIGGGFGSRPDPPYHKEAVISALPIRQSVIS